MNFLKALISPVVNVVGGIIQRKQERKALQVQLDHAIVEKKIDYVKQGRIAEVEWNKGAQNKAGWRPGFLTIVLSAPMILVFIPDMVPYIERGFEVLDKTPIWYRSAIAVMISSAFGFKKYADWQMSKHYTLPDPMDKVNK